MKPSFHHRLLQLVLLAVSVLCLREVTVSQNPSGTIAGLVTSTGPALIPLGGAKVSLRVNSQRPLSPDTPEIMTDAAGRFVFRDVPPGNYVLQISREGYGFRLATYTLNPTRSVPVTVSAGSQVQIPRVELVRAATMRGRVLDANGQGTPGAAVEFLRLSQDEDGQRIWRSVFDPVFTNQEGEYQRGMFAPGDYYLRTVIDSGALTMSIYYPGTSEGSRTAPIVLAEGTDRTIDILTGGALPAQTYSIAGTVSAPASETAQPTAIELVLLRKDLSGSPLSETSLNFSAMASQNLYQGEKDSARSTEPQRFKFPGVPLGMYELIATGQIGDDRYWAKAAIHVRDGDIEDVELLLHQVVDIAGTITFEETPSNVRLAPPATGFGRPQPGDIKLSLRRKDGIPQNLTGRLTVQADGQSFSIRDVPEGEYQVIALLEGNGQPPGPIHYVADIRTAGRSIFDDGFRVGIDAVDSLEVIVGTRGASIHGRIQGTQSPLPAALILVPEYVRRGNPALYRVLYVPRNAEFQMNGIAPGNYKLFAVPYLNETVPYRDPAFIARHESRAVNVSVKKGTTVTGVQAPYLALGR